ncbi:MAG: glyoxalase/bleomycin resistance/extradiol dioxygenase family protein [Flavobacteriaceae bacterium]|nr:glyoxalase/bleomycin resistance/extradiol dioxygenase family protein [Flavobacteriaceae bacterium]|tara:strand:+ start:844 stop:1221 length:378 start_codon:yes stop_codon:yes gene_type:complete
MNLNQVTVPSLNVPKAILFYQKIGLQLIVHTHDAYARFECLEGDATFSIHQVETLPKGSGTIVYFEVADVTQKVSELKEIGTDFETEPTQQTWGWTEARLKDPDGNTIIIYHAGTHRKNPPWRLK